MHEVATPQSGERHSDAEHVSLSVTDLAVFVAVLLAFVLLAVAVERYFARYHARRDRHEVDTLRERLERAIDQSATPRDPEKATARARRSRYFRDRPRPQPFSDERDQ